MVAQAYNPSHLRVEIKRIKVQRQSDKTVRPPSQPISWVWWCDSSYPGSHRQKKSWSRLAWARQKQYYFKKIT
jgi:hypothetical protein